MERSFQNLSIGMSHYRLLISAKELFWHKKDREISDQVPPVITDLGLPHRQKKT